MNGETRELARQLQEADREHVDSFTTQPAEERPSLHYTDLPETRSGGRSAVDWDFYRGEVGRLLAEGHEGRWVLIHQGKFIGIWDTQEEALRVRVDQFLLEQVLIKQILSREPVIRVKRTLHAWRR
jgi:hypothetical protein